MTDTFCGMPEFIWTGIFTAINVLIIGLVLGHFASKYQKRKEVETQIQGEVLRLRLQAYEHINVFFCKFQDVIAPPAYQECEYAIFLNGFSFDYNHIEFCSLFNNESAFDTFYNDMQQLQRTEHPYLDFEVEYRLLRSIGLMTHMKLLLDAFVDMEHLETSKLTQQQAEHNITMAYRLMGIAMQKEMTGLYCKMDKLIAKRLRNITLSYGEPKLRKWIYGIQEKIYNKIEYWFLCKGIRKTIFNAFIKRLLSDQTYKLSAIPSMINVFMYVHYSSQYPPEQIDELDDGVRDQLLLDFYTTFMGLYNV